MPSMPGRPRSSSTRSGWWRAASVERRLARRREVDLVAAAAQVHAERPQDLRLVVDDQHRGSFGAAVAGSSTIIVSPPPGVSSTASSPPMASTKPRATASPSPTPSPVLRSPSRWNGWNTRRARSAAMPGPRSTTRRSTRSPTAARRRTRTVGARRRPRAGRWRRCWPPPARAAPGRRDTAGRRLGHVDSTPCAARSTELAGACGHHLLEAHGPEQDLAARRSAAGSCRAGCRRARLSRSVSSSIVCEELPARPGSQRDVGLQQAGDRRLDRRQRRAQVVGDGLQQRGAQLVGLRPGGAVSAAAAWRRPRCTASASWDSERPQQALVVGSSARRPRAPAPWCRRRVEVPALAVGRLCRRIRPGAAPRPPSRRRGARARRRRRGANVDPQLVEEAAASGSCSPTRVAVGAGQRLGLGPGPVRVAARRLAARSTRRLTTTATARNTTRASDVLGLADREGVDGRR